ncbi:metallophosphoesterase [Iodidimonas gelatinilytica]|uniref:Metallophosphoesterase n=2 Tax=Iodidimonas TaxID=2066486 RepID=A0A5A7MRT2_9PROT|nr:MULTISPECIES: TIGR00282 family metallophosphoesterase [Iodidimonas]GEQ98657.1 metallophosphoesterase [Iodidimonas gelatinilytica]GER06877.1 metallophosphoesterase [Kordiimonadales bacterium JCM 17843]GGO09677.1 metallophosphoesterase [Iodidimonas muriae]
MRVLFLGDIVGRLARQRVVEQMADWRRDWRLDFVIVNGENAAGGFGITAAIADELFAVGVDVITTGNHAWDQKEILSHIDQEPRLLRPANYPDSAPGRGYGIYDAPRGKKVLVMNLMGRVFMNPLDDPFAVADKILKRHVLSSQLAFSFIDFHGEATSEKMAMGQFADGRASCVVGTHSHIPTADAQILPKGTAYQTDAGMCGDYDSVIGMEKEEPLRRFTRHIPGGRFSPALGEPTICGVLVESDNSGRAVRIDPIRIGGRLHEQRPAL